MGYINTRPLPLYITGGDADALVRSYEWVTARR